MFHLILIGNDIPTNDFALNLNIFDIKCKTYNAGMYNFDDLSTRIFNYFNHNEREWTKKIYTNKQFVSLLNMIINNNQNDSFFPIKKRNFI